jgi:hypothetical protein
MADHGTPLARIELAAEETDQPDVRGVSHFYSPDYGKARNQPQSLTLPFAREEPAGGGKG